MVDAPLPRLRILVIEDEPLIAMTIEFSIEGLGHAMIGPIAHLDEALVAAQGDDYDCAIIDINIIGGPSHAVAEIMAARQRPFIVASGYGEHSLPAALRNRPRLTKPYSGAALETELQRMADRCFAQ
jgi:CheY-like chemotaxis protein